MGNIECRQGGFSRPSTARPLTSFRRILLCDLAGRAVLYRDGNRRAMRFARRAEPASDYLCEGGIGHMLGNWACQPDGDWTEPLRRWLDARGCDVLALLHEFDDP
ncbi:MAG: hypothetical protein Udaeo2_28530 [Candidatus Udaeobacter sp.]|nr:MAG: hypothetical protein Udaeo2_28530 [Candidatus Udaeobacter sp.]